MDTPWPQVGEILKTLQDLVDMEQESVQLGVRPCAGQPVASHHLSPPHLLGAHQNLVGFMGFSLHCKVLKIYHFNHLERNSPAVFSVFILHGCHHLFPIPDALLPSAATQAPAW